MAPHIDSFRQARWYTRGRTKPLRLLVLHSTEGQETATSAEATAAYFATIDRKASAHVVIDSDTVVGCVHPTDTAYGAAGANSDGYHIEQCGKAGQTAAQWDDAESRKIVDRCAKHLAECSQAFGIPLRWLTLEQVADRRSKGITDHATVSKAFPDVSTGHWDPGPYYPRSTVVALARSYAQEGPFMALTDAEQAELLAIVRGIGTKNYQFPGGDLTWLADKLEPLEKRLAAIEAKLT